jgi:alanine racemase
MTHLACADAASTADLDAQMIRFDEATARLSRHGIRPDVRHAANSAALLRGAAKLDWARPGVALFGVSPRAVGEGGALQDPFVSDLQPVMRVRTEIVALRPVPTGERIGYGGLWTAARPSIIATIPMGYADGLSRHLTNRGAVLVRGTRAPIAGAVSMDLTMIDVTDVLGVQLRDEVVVLGEQEGPQGVQLLGADEVAGWGGTIPWEVMTQISRRVPRFYREP